MTNTNTTNVSVTEIRAGMNFRIPKKLPKEARHRVRLNALAVYTEPGSKQAWLEVRPGGLLTVVGRSYKYKNTYWRKVKSPDGIIEGYVLESALSLCTLLEAPLTQKKLRLPKPIRITPQLFDWAYVGVDADEADQNLGQCISIEYDRLPDPDYLGLATFRMLDGRSRRAWLIHAQKTQPPLEIS